MSRGPPNSLERGSLHATLSHVTSCSYICDDEMRPRWSGRRSRLEETPLQSLCAHERRQYSISPPTAPRAVPGRIGQSSGCRWRSATHPEWQRIRLTDTATNRTEGTSIPWSCQYCDAATKGGPIAACTPHVPAPRSAPPRHQFAQHHDQSGGHRNEWKPARAIRTRGARACRCRSSPRS